MFEPEGTPTFLGLTADEWESLGAGARSGFITVKPQDLPDCPGKHQAEEGYYWGGQVAGWSLKAVLIILIAQYAAGFLGVL